MEICYLILKQNKDKMILCKFFFIQSSGYIFMAFLMPDAMFR